MNRHRKPITQLIQFADVEYWMDQTQLSSGPKTLPGTWGVSFFEQAFEKRLRNILESALGSVGAMIWNNQSSQQVFPINTWCKRIIMCPRWSWRYLFPDDRLPSSVPQHWKTSKAQTLARPLQYSRAHAVFIATKLLCAYWVTDNSYLLGHERKTKKPTNRCGRGKEQPTCRHMHTIPVVFFLLTVLSALCRFCEDREIKAHRLWTL